MLVLDYKGTGGNYGYEDGVECGDAYGYRDGYDYEDGGVEGGEKRARRWIERHVRFGK